METLRVSLPSPYSAAMAWSRCWTSVCWNTQVSKINSSLGSVWKREAIYISTWPHPALWPGSSGAMTRLIWHHDLGSWHYDRAHPAPGSYDLGSFGTMTQAHPAPSLALVGHALPYSHHSTIWRLGLHCHIYIILQSGGWVCTAAFTSFYNLDQTWIRSFTLSLF